MTIKDWPNYPDINKSLAYGAAAAELISDKVDFKFPEPPDKSPSSEFLLASSMTHTKIIVGDIIPGISEDINACFVGNFKDGVVLVFRGALTPNAGDLASWLDWILVNGYIKEGKATNIPGGIHQGFWAALDSIWQDIVKEVESRIFPQGRNHKPLKLYIAGHSKGGSLATLATARFHFDHHYSPDNLYTRTFAAARVGDPIFASNYTNRFNHIRYEYADDLVPHLPPKDTRLNEAIEFITKKKINLPLYDSAGKLQFINWEKKFEPGTDADLEHKRLLSLAYRIFTLQFKTIADDHAIGYHSGYLTLGTPDTVSTDYQRPSLKEMADFLAVKGGNVELLRSVRQFITEKYKK